MNRKISEEDKKLRLKCLEIADSIPGGLGTPAHRKIMAIMMLPGSESWTITRRCGIIDINTRTWYRIVNDPDFGDNLATAQRRLKGRYAAGVFKSFINKALFGDKDGLGNVTAQLAYLRDVGIIEPERKQFEHTGLEARSKDDLIRELTALGIGADENQPGPVTPSNGDSTGAKIPS